MFQLLYNYNYTKLNQCIIITLKTLYQNMKLYDKKEEIMI